MLIFKFFFTKDNWSRFHDQTLLLAERLDNTGLLNEYIQFTESEDGKNLVVSILKQELAKFDWEIKEIIDFHKVRESAPREIHACLEVVITPQST